MKKIFALILVIVCIAFLFVGCKFFNDEVEDTTRSDTTSPTTTNADMTTDDKTSPTTTNADMTTDDTTSPTKTDTTAKPIDTDWTKSY